MVLTARDQLRQRIVWALAQILVGSHNSTYNLGSVETYANYYDIFVQNVFGNYGDVLREVKYPLMLNIVTCQFMMGEYRVARQLCEQVIGEQDGKRCVKAHYKLAHCYSQLGMFNEARYIFNKLDNQ